MIILEILSIFIDTVIHFPFKSCSAFLLDLLLVEVSAIDLMKNVSIGLEFVTPALKTNVKTGPIKLRDKNRSSPSIFSALVITVAILTSHSFQSLYNISAVSLFLLSFSKPEGTCNTKRLPTMLSPGLIQLILKLRVVRVLCFSNYAVLYTQN